MFQLQTARLILRDLISDDLPLIQAMAQEPAVTRYQSWMRHETEDEARQWLKSVIESNAENPRFSYNLAILEAERDLGIGWIGWGHSSNPEYGDYSFGYALLPEFQGSGIMTEALRAGIDFMFEMLGAKAVTDYCETENIGSLRVMEKCGMKPVAVWNEENPVGEIAEHTRFVIEKRTGKRNASRPNDINGWEAASPAMVADQSLFRESALFLREQRFNAI